MVSVEEASKIIIQHLQDVSTEQVSLEKAHGQILQEDVYGKRAQPPFDRVMMDGIALRVEALKKNSVFQSEGMQAAGTPRCTLADTDNGCLQVMTGAVLPENCDCVIPVEEIELNTNKVIIKDPASHLSGQHIHPMGSDFEAGKLLFKNGIKLQSQHIVGLAGVGKSLVKVLRRPSIAVVSNGDELVDVGEKPEIYQIHPSATYGLLAALKTLGFLRTQRYHFPDHYQTLERGLSHILAQFDMVILSGGVSMGKYDFMPAVLKNLKVKQIFHKVRQRPGKPIWFGRGEKGSLVFGLPGNPVSTLVCFHRLIVPALFPVKPQRINLEKRIENKSSLTCYYPVVLLKENQARQVPYNGSGDFLSLAKSDGFIELPEGQHETADFWRFIC